MMSSATAITVDSTASRPSRYSLLASEFDNYSPTDFCELDDIDSIPILDRDVDGYSDLSRPESLMSSPCISRRGSDFSADTPLTPSDSYLAPDVFENCLPKAPPPTPLYASPNPIKEYVEEVMKSMSISEDVEQSAPNSTDEEPEFEHARTPPSSIRSFCMESDNDRGVLEILVSVTDEMKEIQRVQEERTALKEMATCSCCTGREDLEENRGRSRRRKGSMNRRTYKKSGDSLKRRIEKAFNA